MKYLAVLTLLLSFRPALAQISATETVTESESAPENLSLNQWRFGASGELIGVQAINQESTNWNPAWGLDVGYEFETVALILEARFWDESSQEGSLSVRQNTQQGVLWLRYQREAFDQGLGFIQLGSGLRGGTVESQLGGERINLKKENELVTGGAVGFGWFLLPSWRIETSLKLLKAQTQLTWETSGSLGLQFLL